MSAATAIGNVTVRPPELAARREAIGRVVLDGRPGFTDLEEDDLQRFVPIGDLEVPDGPEYTLLDVGTGAELLNVTPNDALEAIGASGRSPLTIDEALALVIAQPEVLRTHNCFSILGSRCGDKRVPALWVAKGGRPRLGWCWAGNPHTWLGSASCAGRTVT